MGEQVYRASVQLPKNSSAGLPPDSKLTSDFADYSSHYSSKDGVLDAERKLTIKKAKVGEEHWDEYQTFLKSFRADQAQTVLLIPTLGSPDATGSDSNPDAQRLIRAASTLAEEQHFADARDLLAQVERLTPKQPGLWNAYGHVEAMSFNGDEAVADYRKELEHYPGDRETMLALSSLLMREGKDHEAFEIWKEALAQDAENDFAAFHAATLLMQAKRFEEIPAAVDKAIAAKPLNYGLQALRAASLLRYGQKAQGLLEAQRIAKAASDAFTLNELAYSLADTDVSLAFAQELAERSVKEAEHESANLSLTKVDNQDLLRPNALGSSWDTLGWAYFKRGDLLSATKFIQASWQLTQHAEAANHLGQIYEKQGRSADAVRMWQLALAVNARHQDAKERLQKAEDSLTGASSPDQKKDSSTASPGEELGKLRTFAIPLIPSKNGNTECYMLFSKSGIENVRTIRAADVPTDAASVIRATNFNFAFPDDGPEKVIRQGTLWCSQYGKPNCRIDMVPPSMAKKSSKTD